MAKLGLSANRILLAMGAFVMPILLAETAARQFAPLPPANTFPGLMPNETPDPDLLWKARAGYQGNALYGPMNTEGFRGPSTSTCRRPGEIVILSLGESTTFGYNLKWTESYSHIVESRLLARGHDVRVLNAGMRGWTTFQSTRYLELNIARISPHLVLFYHENNDFLPTTFRALTFRGAGLTDSQAARVSRQRSVVLRIINSSRFLTWLRLMATRAEASAMTRHFAALERQDVLRIGTIPYDVLLDTSVESEKPWMDNLNQLVRVPDMERKSLLRTAIRLTGQNGAQLVLLHPVYPVSKRHRCLLTRIAEEEGVPLLDMEDVIQADADSSGRHKSDYFFGNDQFHPNVLGNTVMGTAIADFLEREGLLSVTDSLRRPRTSTSDTCSKSGAVGL